MSFQIAGPHTRGRAPPHHPLPQRGIRTLSCWLEPTEASTKPFFSILLFSRSSLWAFCISPQHMLSWFLYNVWYFNLGNTSVPPGRHLIHVVMLNPIQSDHPTFTKGRKIAF